jgi:hypothetical protein
VNALSPETISLIVVLGALIAPPVVSLLKRSHWSPTVKQFVVALVSLAIAAAAIAIVSRRSFGLPFMTLASFIFAGSQLIYGAYFRGSGADNYLTAIGSVLGVTAAQPDEVDTAKPTALAVTPGPPGP